jgi:hypothetical protein
MTTRQGGVEAAQHPTHTAPIDNEAILEYDGNRLHYYDYDSNLEAIIDKKQIEARIEGVVVSQSGHNLDVNSITELLTSNNAEDQARARWLVAYALTQIREDDFPIYAETRVVALGGWNCDRFMSVTRALVYWIMHASERDNPLDSICLRINTGGHDEPTLRVYTAQTGHADTTNEAASTLLHTAFKRLRPYGVYLQAITDSNGRTLYASLPYNIHATYNRNDITHIPPREIAASMPFLRELQAACKTKKSFLPLPDVLRVTD